MHRSPAIAPSPLPHTAALCRYDQYGEEGVESGGGGSQADLFSELFGGGGGRRGRSGPRKGEDIVHHIQVGLVDLFKGKVRHNAPSVHTSP